MLFLLFLQPDWQLAEMRLLLLFILLNTHLSLAETPSAHTPWLRVLVKQVSAIILEVSAGLAPNSAVFFFSASLLISTVVKELLRSAFTSAGCCLHVVLHPAPPCTGIRRKCSYGNCQSLRVCFSADLSGFPSPSPSPIGLLRPKIAPAVLWCVLSSLLLLLHSLRRWCMRHCFSSPCFSKLLSERA